MRVEGILLAAGASRRMGGLDKLVEEVRGAPLLRDRAMMLLGSALADVHVVLPSDRPARHAAIADLGVHPVTNMHAEQGMASSINAGIAAVSPKATAALIMPADMPDIRSQDIDAMVDAARKQPARIWRATGDGGPGSPVIFPRAYFAQLLKLQGDESGRVILKQAADQVDLIALEGRRAVLDLDIPEAWAAWRADQS